MGVVTVNETLIGATARDPEAAGEAEARRERESDAMRCRRRRGRELRLDGGRRRGRGEETAAWALCSERASDLPLLRVSVPRAELFMSFYYSILVVLSTDPPLLS